jgi:hypothetical protein
MALSYTPTPGSTGNLVSNSLQGQFNRGLQNPLAINPPGPNLGNPSAGMGMPAYTPPGSNGSTAGPSGSPGASNTGNGTAGGYVNPATIGYASNFTGGSNDPNVFTTNQYDENLNQNSLASMASMGQVNGNANTAAFQNVWNQYGQAGAAYNAQAIGNYMDSLGNVTQNEMADPNSNLYQVPQVQAGQPYQHFMQSLNFGTTANPNIQTQQGGLNNPYGYNNWNPNGTQSTSVAASPSGYSNQFGAGGVPNQQQNGPVGGYGGFQAGTPVGATGQVPMSQANPQIGGEVTGTSGNGFNPPTGNYSWSQGSPIAGGYNNWGAPYQQSGTNPYAYMTNQPTNGLNGQTIYSGTPSGAPNQMWSPNGADMSQGYPNTNGTTPNFNYGFSNQNVPGAGAQVGAASNPMNSAGSMGNLSQMYNAIMQMMGGV